MYRFSDRSRFTLRRAVLTLSGALAIGLTASLMAPTAHAQTVFSYAMNETNWLGTAPQIADGSGNGHNGTAIGGANTVTDPTYGKVGSFSGSGQYVTVGGSGTISGARTIVAWIDPVAFTSSLGMPILVGGSSGLGDFFGLAGTGGESGANGAVPHYGLYVDHWGNASYGSTAVVTPGVWSQVAVTFNGTNQVSFYINGVDAGNVTTGPNPSFYNYGVSSYTVGGSTIGGTTTLGSFDGDMRNVTEYGTALTSGQIATLYATGSASGPEPSAFGFVALAGVPFAAFLRHRRK